MGLSCSTLLYKIYFFGRLITWSSNKMYIIHVFFHAVMPYPLTSYLIFQLFILMHIIWRLPLISNTTETNSKLF